MKIRGARTKQDVAGNSRRVGRSLAVLGSSVALAAATMFTAPAAHADGSICNPGNEVCAEFQSYGEVFTVHDYKSDGYAALGFLTWPGHQQAAFECLNSNGASGAAEKCDYDFTEGFEVIYWVCKYKASTGPVDCSRDVHDFA